MDKKKNWRQKMKHIRTIAKAAENTFVADIQAKIDDALAPITEKLSKD